MASPDQTITVTVEQIAQAALEEVARGLFINHGIRLREVKLDWRKMTERVGGDQTWQINEIEILIAATVDSRHTTDRG